MLMTPQSWSHSEAGGWSLLLFWVTDFRLIPRRVSGTCAGKVLRRELTATRAAGERMWLTPHTHSHLPTRAALKTSKVSSC